MIQARYYIRPVCVLKRGLRSRLLRMGNSDLLPGTYRCDLPSQSSDPVPSSLISGVLLTLFSPFYPSSVQGHPKQYLNPPWLPLSLSPCFMYKLCWLNYKSPKGRTNGCLHFPSLWYSILEKLFRPRDAPPHQLPEGQCL